MNSFATATARCGRIFHALPLLCRPLLLGVVACAPAVTGQASVVPAEAHLPPVPEIRGDLRIDVVYPAEGATIGVRDSTFIFGNTGRGDALLTINGAPVEVAPNGAWLAFLPVPADGAYRLSASANGQTLTQVRQVQVAAPPVEAMDGALHIVEGSVVPSGVRTAVRGEPIEVRFRGTPGAAARLLLADGTSIPLVERNAIDRSAGFMLDRVEAEAGISEYVGAFELTEVVAGLDPASAPTLSSGSDYAQARARQEASAIAVELARGGEVVRVPIAAAVGVLEPGRPRVAIAATARPDGTVIGRRQTGADQAWDFFWPNGTLLAIDGEAAGMYRVRLTATTTAWVAQDDVRLLPEGTPAPRGFIGPSIQLAPLGDRVEIRFATSASLPFRVVPAERGITVEFYGATGRPAYVGYGGGEGFVELVEWDQPADDLFRFDVRLDRPLWGYRYHWEPTALVVEVRSPPVIDPAAPLRGLRIAIDAGHRGSATDIGAIGPTRLTEAEATLAVTQRLGPMLRAAGAEVVDIRPDTAIVPLIERPIRAASENAHLFVSVHFNAFPDGVNPFENHGTTNFYFWPQSLELARHFQREILGEFGLPDRGVRFQNLAIPRTQWMPSVLTETLFMMFPEQEAALRDPRTLDRIAAAHLRAMESFVRERAIGPSSEVDR